MSRKASRNHSRTRLRPLAGLLATALIFTALAAAQSKPYPTYVPGPQSNGTWVVVVSPYAVQGGPTDHTYYTQVNMTRTIEQILGLTPMNQFDLVASPMRTAFVEGVPPAENFQPWTHVPNQVPLCDSSVTGCLLPSTAAANVKETLKLAALRKDWLRRRRRSSPAN